MNSDLNRCGCGVVGQLNVGLDYRSETDVLK